jgi:hypothetical protein
VELPQLFTTVTVGAGTLAFNGAAIPLPEGLVHPFTVCVTVYVPAVVTVIDGAVAPVLQSNDPVNDPAVNCRAAAVICHAYSWCRYIGI